MGKYIFYEKATGELKNYYEEQEKKTYGGPLGDPTLYVQVDIPEGIDYRKYNLFEVPLEEGQTEADIEFDYKHEYYNFIGEYITEYYKFFENFDKTNDVDLQDAVDAARAAKNARAMKGLALRTVAERLYAIITDYIYEGGYTPAEIETFKATYPEIFNLLAAKQPLTAKTYIDALVVGGIITQDLKNDLAMEYSDFFSSYPEFDT